MLIAVLVVSCKDEDKALDNKKVLGKGAPVIQQVIMEEEDNAIINNDLTSGETAIAIYAVKTNLSKNWIEFIDSEGNIQRFTFKNNSRPTYKITFTLLTKLKKRI